MITAEARWSLELDDAQYPSGLADLEPAERPALRGLGRRELVQGLRPDDAVTIVGSRRATSYGLRVAEDLGRDLASAGVVIVSGMAIGIDGAAHRGALAAEGKTIAVLAGGADVVYPGRHRGLHRRIVESGGAVVSEQPFGAQPRKYDFPARNRIMAALSAVVVVVEAAEPSGTLVTANRARDLGRDLAAIPGPVGARASTGTNSLLKDGCHLVRDAQDVLDLLAGVGVVTLVRSGPALTPELDRVLEAVENGAVAPDELTRAMAIDGRTAAIALARLQLLGFVARDELGGFARTGLARARD